MFLRDLWYFALPGARLKPGHMTPLTLLGETLVLGRLAGGEAFALADRCPHRAMPLSEGRFDGAEIECCYHGWRFDNAGACTAIPSLADGAKLDISRIRAKAYPCREVQGNIWVYFADDKVARPLANALPDPPSVPEMDDRAPRLFEDMLFPCHVDHAVVGLMDPAHGPFVHRAWWWRSRKSIHEKARRFEPAPLGFRMARHRPSSNSFAYKLLGGEMTTEISFQLPGVRIEHVKAGRHTLCGLTAVTPVSETETRVNHAIYWTMPWLGVLKPALRPFARAFLAQDRSVVARQQRGLAGDPPLILIDDADTQAKWYYRLKKEYARAVEAGTPFQNPVTERVLKWRS